jgi:hypothetical protein
LIFHNTAKHDLRFELRGVRYSVPANGNIEIPDGLAYAVSSRGLPLVKGEAQGAPMGTAERIIKAPQIMPRGIMTGDATRALKQLAREENEDFDDGGDGPAFEGDDEGETDEEDPIKKTVAQLEKAGIEVIPGRRRRK